MRPGLIVQYARTPERTGERVRSDVAGIVGFIPPERWPEGATSGTTSRWFFTKGRLRGHPIKRFSMMLLKLQQTPISRMAVLSLMCLASVFNRSMI